MKELDITQLQDSRPMILKLAEKKNNIAYENLFRLPTTLGKPKKGSPYYKKSMAMDACIKNVLSNFKNDMSYAAFPAFVGYALLSSVSQEALIRAGVETIADEMTRKFVTWTYDDDNGKDDKEKIINTMETLASKYRLKEVFNEAMIKDGLFGGCLVYIDVGDIDDEEKREPLILDKKTFKKGSFRGFKVIEPVNISAGNYNTSDPTDEHYFNPEFWYILGKPYHASRFLYFASNDTPVLLKPVYNFFGIPQAQLALDYVAHFVANREAAQELLNKFSLTCFGTDMSQGLQANGSWADLIARMKMFNKLKTNNGTFVYNKETEELSQINTPLGGVREIVEMSLNLLTAVWRIPKIKYIGEGEGGLNASSKEQMRSFYDYIMSMKEKCFTQPLETVLKIFQLNEGMDIDESLGFKYPQMWDMDESERAALNKQQADRDAIYLANGVLSQEEVRRRLSLDKNSEYSMIDVDELPEPTEQPLQDVDKEEQDETERQAMDMSMDFSESLVERKHGRFYKWFHREKENIINVVPNRYWSASMDLEELRNQAKNYYKENLAGTETKNKKTGRVIKFSNSAFKKVQAFSADERKLRVVPYIKEIIENGDLQQEENRKNKNKNEKWWRIRCDIVYGGKPEAVGVNIREDQNGNLYYDHYIVNERETLGSQSQSISPITSDSIAENEYVVNIFFE